MLHWCRIYLIWWMLHVRVHIPNRNIWIFSNIRIDVPLLVKKLTAGFLTTYHNFRYLSFTYRFCHSLGKGIVFFFSPEKFDFYHFLAKIEWVSENAVFFFPPCFFFFPSLKSSEWVGCKLFQEKMKKKFQDFGTK